MTTGKVSDAVAAIEAQLAAVWAPPDPESGELAKVRASMMNLVVETVTSDLDRWRATTDELMLTHPGRVLLLTIDGRLAPWDVAGDVSAVCRVEGGSAPVCSDRIELAFGVMAATRAPSVVASLSLAEVPTLLEIAPGAPGPVAAALARAADRVIVDSASTSLARIVEVARATKAPVADRAWVRTYTWRELTARFFDDAPEALRAVCRVEIARTAGKHDPAPLFLGWLASRLGWRPVAADRAEGPGGPVELVLTVDPREDAGPSALTGVHLHTAVGDAAMTLSCTRGASPGVIAWQREGARAGRHEHPLGFRDETWVAIKAIDGTEQDGVYREALFAAAAWVALREKAAS